MENVWQFVRDNWLSNRVFGSYEEIVDHCCEAWNKLVEQPWIIMSIVRRQGILDRRRRELREALAHPVG
jgi:hypothetical protein